MCTGGEDEGGQEMKREWVAAAIACAVLVGIGVDARAQEAAPLQVERFVFCTRLEKLEPVEPGDRLPSGREMIIAFLEARQITADTTVTFVWIYGDKELRSMTVPIPKGPRWRTFDGKIPESNTGPWRVELRDAAGKVIRSASFIVE
jgi:hypothetical protein